MRIRTMRSYRAAVTEVQTLERAREGESEHARRQELLAAMHLFEQQHQLPAYRPGKPAPFALKEGTSAPRKQQNDD